MTVNVIPSSPLLRTHPVSPLLISKWYNKIFIWGTREMTWSVKCMLYRYEGLGCNSQISKRGKAGNGSIHTYNSSTGETDKQSSGAQCPLNLVCLESPSERPCPPQKKVDSDWVQSLEHVVKPVSLCKVASFISGSGSSKARVLHYPISAHKGLSWYHGAISSYHVQEALWGIPRCALLEMTIS